MQNETVQRLAILVALIVIWQLYARWLNNTLLFPTFTETARTFWHDMRNGVLIDRTITSMRTLALGYALRPGAGGGVHHLRGDQPDRHAAFSRP